MISSITLVPFIACAVNSPSTFAYCLELSNFLLKSGLLYLRVSSICLQLVYFVSAAECHCFDLLSYQFKNE